MRVGEHRQHATNIRMGYRIVIQIEADIGRFADADGNALEQRRRVVGQRQQARRFLDEHLADATFEVFGTASVGGLSIAPGLSLDIEIIEIGERASREERITYVTYGSLHAAFFVPACHRHRAGFITVVSGKAEQCRMEANRIAASFQDCTLEIIVVMCRPPLCAGPPANPGTARRSGSVRPHINQSAASHSRSFGSLCHIGFRGGPTDVLEGGRHASRASCFILIFISA
jgi:hypothetical protein